MFSLRYEQKPERNFFQGHPVGPDYTIVLRSYVNRMMPIETTQSTLLETLVLDGTVVGLML